jgi:isoleucyl-tRNA synthetase
MGTALNKVLKDLIVKSKTMAGFHHALHSRLGLPRPAHRVQSGEIRRRSHPGSDPHALRGRGPQVHRHPAHSFKRLGVFGDWENPYLTLDPGYESGILRTFGKAVEKGLVYRMKRPVLWSYGAQTALAEAEVEYKEKTSPAVYVKFALVTPPPGL